MKKYLFLTVFLFPLLLGSKAVEYSDKEKLIIITNSIKVLENYQRIINQMGEYVVNDIEKAKGGAEGFLDLFVNRQVLIYNDLDPAHKLSEFYEAETYSNNIILWYPDGISITLDLANVKGSEIITHEENVFSIDILVKKTINGNYLNQTLNRNTEELTFRIAFGSEIKDPLNFKIVGIRNSESKFAINDAQALKEVNSVDVNPEDLIKIKSEIKTKLQDYRNFLALIGDPQETADDKNFYKESFMKLFPETGIRVYNDIMPAAQTKLIPVSDYLSAYIADYPEGIKNLSINTDSAKFGKVMKADDGSFYTYTDVNKFFSGNYKGKEVFREMFPLIFKMSFKEADNTFTDFRITSIDLSAHNFYETTAVTAAAKPEIVLKQISRNGLSISPAASFGRTIINNPNIESLSMNENYHEWKVTPQFGYTFGLNVNYYFTDNISARSGIEYQKYSTKFQLAGNFVNGVQSVDANGDLFYSNVIASFDSVVTINMINLPLLVGYTSGKPGQLGYYAEGGVKISIPQKVAYSNSGNYKYTALPYGLFYAGEACHSAFQQE
ncbi:MAG: outer membrane beta-barrel protein [Bacteroidia bacterium]|nr:outer membrane beta-barrel protein [Bacteroidia bacterium]